MLGAQINEAVELVGLSRSGVTGKPRRVLFAVGNKIRQSASYPLVVVTRDVADGEFDPAKDAIYTLGEGFKADGSENIAMLSNGFGQFTIFNAAGELVDEVPPNVAIDHRAPAPHTKRVHGAITCIRCHGSDELWKPANNDVLELSFLPKHLPLS